MTATLSLDHRPPRFAVVRSLFAPTGRTLPFLQLLAGGTGALVVAAASHRLPELTVGLLVGHLRLAMPLLAVGIAGILDDQTRPHLDGTPVSLALRQWLRVVMGLAITVGWWTVAVLVVQLHPGADGGLPMVGLSVELTGLVAVTLAAAGLATRRGGSGAVAGGAAALSSALIAGQLMPSAWLLPDYLPPGAGEPVDPMWIAAHLRVAALAVVAVGLLAWAVRDPGRRWRSHVADHRAVAAQVMNRVRQ